MIVDALEDAGAWFTIWSLMLTCRGWKSVVSGGEGTQESEEIWEQRYHKMMAGAFIPPLTGTQTWRRLYFARLKSRCFNCQQHTTYKKAYRSRPELSDRTWAVTCRPCSGDTIETYYREMQICGKCKDRKYAFACSEKLCLDCCKGCPRHPKGRRSDDWWDEWDDHDWY